MINPILASSARRRMRSVKTPLLLTLYCLVLVGFMYFYSFREMSQPTITIPQMSKGIEGYALLLGLQFALLVLVAPAMTAGSIAGERERQTLDLLRVTNTGSVSIVLGKLLESFGFLCLLIISSIPVLSLILMTGGAGFGQILLSVLYLLLVALAVLSIGLFASTLFKRVATATVSSYLMVFGLGVLTLIPLWWDTKIFGAAYDAANNAGIALESMEHTPISFIINPALGLVSLIASQTQAGIVQSLFWRVSQTLSVTYQWLDFKRYFMYHMIFLAGGSVVLILLSAWFVRPKKRDVKIVKRKKG